MSHAQRCRGCSATGIDVLARLGEQPLSNRFLATPNETQPTFALTLVQCATCGMVQLERAPPVSEIRPRFAWIAYNEPEPHLDDLADALMALPGVGPDSRVIGATYKDDTLLRRLRERGVAQTWRLDPKDHLGISATNAGVETIAEALRPEIVARIGGSLPKADVLIARHVYEHADDARGFLDALHQLVSPQGVVVLEVPECGRMLAAGDVTVVWEEHILYLTAHTFASAVRAAGFDIVDQRSYPYPMEDSLIIVARPTPRGTTPTAVPVPSQEFQRAHAFGMRAAARREAIHATLEKARKSGPVALLGANHLAVAFLEYLGAGTHVDFVVDDDPNKQGLLMPGSRLPILPSAALVEREVKLCLLAVNPHAEERVPERQGRFIAAGGRFASIFALSTRTIDVYPLPLRRKSAEVLSALGPTIEIGDPEIALVRRLARDAPRRRVRICAHTSGDAAVHEMLIALDRECYIRPHRHVDKVESYHVIEGEADAVEFNEDGKVLRVTPMGARATGKPFFQRAAEQGYHMFVVRSPTFVFFETTNGPFDPARTTFAPWSPAEDDAAATARFLEGVRRQVDQALAEGRA